MVDAKAGAGPVGHPGVKGNTDDGDIRPVHLVQTRQPGESRRSGIPGNA